MIVAIAENTLKKNNQNGRSFLQKSKNKLNFFEVFARKIYILVDYFHQMTKCSIVISNFQYIADTIQLEKANDA